MDVVPKSLGRCAVVVLGLLVASPSFAGSLGTDQQRADEQEMLAKARAEAGGVRADSHAKRRPNRLVGTVDAPSPSGVAEIGKSDADREAEARKREAELQRLSEKLRRAHMARARTAPPVDRPWITEVSQALPDDRAVERRFEGRSALGHRAAAAVQRAADERATVLLVMTPGNKGIRRFEKTADPILCSNDGCYISNGAETAARFISLRQSLGVINTLGPRAGACRQSTGCVFRGVDVSRPNTILQPVDLKVLVHDRRAIVAANLDDTCSVTAGHLTCKRPLKGADFVMWIVPESVASMAGSVALRMALDRGLGDESRASLR